MASLAIVACNAILGIESRPLRDEGEDDGGSSSLDREGGSPTNEAGQQVLPDGAPASAYRAAVLEDQPVVYLRLGEAKGSTVAHNEGKGTSLDGTYPGDITFGQPGILASDPNTSIEFSATRITMPNGVDFPEASPFSAEAWVKVDDLTAGDEGYLVDHSTFDGPRVGWSLIFGKTKVSLERWQSSSIHDELSDNIFSQLTLSEWHHIVGVFDGIKMFLYVDKNSLGSITAKAKVPALTNGFTVGGRNCSCALSDFTGRLDEVAIYDHALSEDRIKVHYNLVK